MHYGPESLKSEGMLAVEINENDRQYRRKLELARRHQSAPPAPLRLF